MPKKKKFKSEWNRGEGPIVWIPVIIVFLLIAGAVFVFWPYGDPLPEPMTEEPTPATETEQPAAEEPAGPKYPLPDTTPTAETPEQPGQPEGEQVTETETEAGPEPEPAPPAEPLPSLDQSDGPLRQSLEDVVAQKRFEELFIPESMIRHFVVTIDNMTRPKLPEKYDFTQPVPGDFKVEEIGDDDEDKYRLDPANYDRYRPCVVVAASVNLDRLVSIYVRYYPLFQAAYEELGYPDRYFNDRFVEVIDHMLAAPRVEQPIELVRPKVFYEFADPRLENLSAGHKLMIRIGPDNAARIKSVLRRLREKLTGVAVGGE